MVKKPKCNECSYRAGRGLCGTMTAKEHLQEQANGIILACSTLISDMAVSMDNVTSVLTSAGVTKEEWNKCEDEISKENIMIFFDGQLGKVLDWSNEDEMVE